MNSCTYVRWHLRSFLEGSLSESEADQVCGHLDRCSHCVESLIAADRLEGNDIAVPNVVSDTFTQRVLEQIPEYASPKVMFRYLCGVFIASASLGISIFICIRYYFGYGDHLPVNLRILDSTGSLFPTLEKIVAIPAVQYSLFVILTAALCLVIVLLVDSPKEKSRARANIRRIV